MKMIKNLRDYQQQNAIECADILRKNKIVYIQHEVRCGKTATALETIRLNVFKNVLFITKKKAISSIEEDYTDFQFNQYFALTVTNYESIHKIESKDFDCIVLDENHVNSAFPKPSQRTKQIKLMFGFLPMIMLSGTPATESSSQWYHQFWMSSHSPFKNYTNFYKWAKDYVNVQQRNLGYGLINDYSQGIDEKINQSIKHLVHKFTQEEAGFVSKINIQILNCEMLPTTMNLSKRLQNEKVIQGKGHVVLADSSVKLQNKLHQICSGTVKFECGESMTLDYTKAVFIKKYFENKKIAIFYYFKEEYKMIKSVFGDEITDSLDEFKSTEKSIALQQYSASEGISLAKAESLIFLNFGFSGSKFIQALDRLTTMKRKENNIYFVFGKGGIESKVYKAVSQKKTYTLNQFKRDYDISK
jgi:hypothetical protein